MTPEQVPAPLPPSDRGPRRTAVVALAPVLASAVALLAYEVVGRLAGAAAGPGRADVIDLGPAVAVLLGGGAAAGVVWAVGLRVVVGALFPAPARSRIWWQLVGAGLVTLVVGSRALALLLPVSVPLGGWLLQQVALVLVAVAADRRLARAETVSSGS